MYSISPYGEAPSTALRIAKTSLSSIPLCHANLHRLLSASVDHSTAAASHFLSKKAQITRFREKLIKEGKWREKESMDIYLQNALAICNPYVESTKLTDEEEDEFKAIKEWFHTTYTPQKSTLLPFLKLETSGPTFDEFGGDYLTDIESAFYLDQGLLGPQRICSLTPELLESIANRFTHFNKDYYARNLCSSLYSALKNRCLFELVTNKEILSKVSSILGSNIALSNLSVHEVGPMSGKASTETKGAVNAFNCHSDLSSGSHYYFERGADQVKNLVLDNRGVCVWVSITGTEAENAPLYLFPKTHRWEITTPFTYIEKARNNAVELDKVLKLLALRHRNPARRIGLCNLEYEHLLSSSYQSTLPLIKRTEVYTKPGDVILFNQHTRHGSGFNTSKQPRLAISLRYNTALKEVGGIESAGAVVSKEEREALGFTSNSQKPMVQLLGDLHHPNNVPIDLKRLASEGV